MSLKHKVRISVSRPESRPSEVIRSGSREVRSKLLNWLFGEKVGVFVLTPGRTVETVEIQEIQEGETPDEQDE
ncbi:MAG: hypothetical protein LBU62_03485 [Bacteroidales bacterium]|jgi:hypothetical protein|nr:hypothetical protein [Bacteroidales bacterium]